MNGIEFEENKIYQTKKTPTNKLIPSESGVFMHTLFKIGVTDQNTANYILLGVAAIFFGITIYIYSGLFNKANLPKTAPDEQSNQAIFIKESLPR